MQRVGAVEILFAVVSQLGAKLTSTDRGQASEVTVGGCFFVRGSSSCQMARVKNAGGGPGDEDPRRPPRLPTDPKGKATKKVATKKRKYPDADIARATTVVEAAEHAERGGARSGVVIADQQLPPATREALEEVERCHGGPAGTIMVAGRRHAIDEG